MNDILNDYKEVRECVYKNHTYLVRDNGAVYRKANNRVNKNDNIWTFGRANKDKYMLIGSDRVHIIVATAFYGAQDSKQYVVDHIDTNRSNNRVENLRWVTKLENMLMNPVTRKKLLYYYNGDISKFLENPSSIREFANKEPNIAWMRTVSSSEAKNAYARVMMWANERDSKPKNSNNKIGEWIYERLPDYKNDVSYKLNAIEENLEKNKINKINLPNVNNENDDYIQSYTDNALQPFSWIKGRYFPLCPLNISNNPILDYFNNIKENEIITYNQDQKSIVMEYALCDNNTKISVIVSLKDNIKPYGVLNIEYKGGKFIHSGNTYFEYESAKKELTLAKGEIWTAGLTFDELL